ncbi:hypothetical protein [Aneurinibacillus aneurinilyticus]|nr:hypothetical protein [Aneurinibacillus aneurinilyticus]MCI1694532.1 hypothetical protein [Aneurinibacillus aneurinilyticus]MED0670897.1 hypothetical protein [Aneurinibacillus aneurinilyticus]MED0705607.1 hypothetical protein [Aneurinibacillus aneurinilyticus]MED0724498.1 hypothetical protein [Aneurinibacillus aneurinilyticus]MED0731333.1 hypothetical protein [Aneurinibacillus aneurinilyticus]
MLKKKLFRFGAGNWRKPRDPCGGVRQGHVSVSEDFLAIQQLADRGAKPWRLNPVETARKVGIEELGFDVADVFRFESYRLDYDSGLNRAQVKAQHGSCLFLIELYQPVRRGTTGIWAVESVTLLNE